MIAVNFSRYLPRTNFQYGCLSKLTLKLFLIGYMSMQKRAT